jgi:UDPglucose 6-dehydrogenase
MQKNMKKKIAIIGHGYVGQAVERFFKDHFDVVTIDPKEDQDQQYRDKQREINETADLAVVCVPTPMSADGSVDLSIIRETLAWLNTSNILIKSTIPPGTTEMLSNEFKKNIAFSPEYIGEGKYVVQWWKDKGYPHPTDMKYHDFQIFGGAREVTTQIIPFFQRVAGPDVKYMQTDSKTAELVKYMENSWGYAKVMFCNEFYDIAKAFGIDYNELRELWLLDGRVERMHTAVFEDDRKVGGKCFPKDVNGIVKASEVAGFEPKLIKAILAKNEEIKS